MDETSMQKLSSIMPEELCKHQALSNNGVQPGRSQLDETQRPNLTVPTIVGEGEQLITAAALDNPTSEAILEFLKI